MAQEDFTIIFKMLSEISLEEGRVVDTVPSTETDRAEIDEIAELRRLAHEVSESESSSYTTT